MVREFPVLIICIVGSLLTAISLLNTIRVAVKNQTLAFAGDEKAATRLILPCYKPLFRGLVAFYFLFAIVLSFSYLHPQVSSPHLQTQIIEYYCFTVLGVYSITPVLLMQSSVSITGFWRTFYSIAPWWLLCNIIWCIATFVPHQMVQLAFSIIFIIVASVVPLVVATLILSRVVKTRVQIKSLSNRNSIELMLFYSVVFCVSYVVVITKPDTHFSMSTWMTCVSFVTNMIFPFFIYRTLLADTKYWRGLGRHNKKGMDSTDVMRETGVELHRPTMEFGFAASTFQTVMSELDDITIDFAFLQLQKQIGEGATSKVYSGRFKTKLVAVKLSTPPEVTEEAINEFCAEAKIASQLSHPNVVQFVGICIRPPQIAMVFEFCEGGNLKTHLQKHWKTHWTPQRRIHACSDAAKGIACLHAANFIHRDLKAENFFVGKKNVVKLGDFGESTAFRNEESVASRRMSVCGTVSFMAPELIRAARHYTAAIDIYALGVTFWEIWTGEDPYSDKTQFQIYDGVMKGLRPTLPTDAPVGLKALLDMMWLQDSSARPSADEVVELLKHVNLGSDATLAADTSLSTMTDVSDATLSEAEMGNIRAVADTTIASTSAASTTTSTITAEEDVATGEAKTVTTAVAEAPSPPDVSSFLSATPSASAAQINQDKKEKEFSKTDEKNGKDCKDESVANPMHGGGVPDIDKTITSVTSNSTTVSKASATAVVSSAAAAVQQSSNSVFGITAISSSSNSGGNNEQKTGATASSIADDDL